MATSAKASFVRVPPRKARVVADMVRGKGAKEATSILRFSPQKSAKILGKLLKSAVANASTTAKADAESLFVKEIRVDSGPIMKRFTSRAQGRGTRVNKRTSHITLVLEQR